MSGYNGYTGIKGNEYDLTGEYGIGYCSPHGEPFFFDLEDYDKVKKYTWGARYRLGREKDGYYVESSATRDINGEKKSIRIHLHHYLMGYDDIELRRKGEKVIVDHRNKEKHDCRKENMRVSNIRSNAINKPKQKSNTSGIVGVNFNKIDKKWVARIYVQKDKRVTLGKSEDIVEATKMRLYGEYKYYGEYAPQKHLFEEYGVNEETTKAFFDNPHTEQKGLKPND